MCLLRMEILAFGLVQQAWGLGPIKCKLEKKLCNSCGKKHCALYGYYRNYHDLSIKSVFLGRSYASAHSRMNHVKSFLWKNFFLRRVTGIGYHLRSMLTFCHSPPRNTSLRSKTKLHWSGNPNRTCQSSDQKYPFMDHSNESGDEVPFSANFRRKCAIVVWKNIMFSKDIIVNIMTRQKNKLCF